MPHTVAAAAILRHRVAGVQPIGPRLSLFPQTLIYDHTAIRSPCLPFNGLHRRIHIIAWNTTHLPTPKGWKVELAKLLPNSVFFEIEIKVM